MSCGWANIESYSPGGWGGWISLGKKHLSPAGAGTELDKKSQEMSGTCMLLLSGKCQELSH